jgi:hypothetical protein
VVVEVSELVGQDVRVWAEVKRRFAEALLHAYDVKAKAILAGDFTALRKVIDFLVLIETLVQIRFAGGGAPKQVPLVALSHGETVLLKHRATKLVFKSDELVEELAILDMIALLIVVVRLRGSSDLLFRDGFKGQEFTLVLVVPVVEGI